eukprot:4501272-Prymnesium_polylepis.1
MRVSLLGSLGWRACVQSFGSLVLASEAHALHLSSVTIPAFTRSSCDEPPFDSTGLTVSHMLGPCSWPTQHAHARTRAGEHTHHIVIEYTRDTSVGNMLCSDGLLDGQDTGCACRCRGFGEACHPAL